MDGEPLVTNVAGLLDVVRETHRALHEGRDGELAELRDDAGEAHRLL